MSHLPLTWDCKYFTHNISRNIACGGEIQKPYNTLRFITTGNNQVKMEWLSTGGIFAANTVKFMCYRFTMILQTICIASHLYAICDTAGTNKQPKMMLNLWSIYFLLIRLFYRFYSMPWCTIYRHVHTCNIVVNSLVKQSPKFYRTCLSTCNSGITGDFKCNTKHHMPQTRTVDTYVICGHVHNTLYTLYRHRNAIHTQFQQTGTDKHMHTDTVTMNLCCTCMHLATQGDWWTINKIDSALRKTTATGNKNKEHTRILLCRMIPTLL